jgi:putative inorganic carbon (hco3(-)) transporter
MLNHPGKYLKGAISFFILPIAVAASFLVSLWQPQYFIPMAAIFMIGSAYMIIRFELQAYLLKFIALLLPFSVEMPLNSSSMILFPGEILVGIAGLTLFIDIILQPRLFKRYFSGEVLYALPLVFIYIISSLFSTMPSVSVKFIFIHITYILVFLFFLKSALSKQPQLFIRLVALYSLSFSLVIAYATFRFWQFGFNPVVVKGIFQPFYKDHTITGATAGILSAYWLANAFNSQRLLDKLIQLFAGFFFLYAVFLTHSRAAIYSLLAFAGIWVILRLKIHYRYLALISAIAVFLAVIFHQQLYDKLYYNKFVSRKQKMEWPEFLKSVGNVTTDESNVERLNRWYSGIKMFMARPVTGFGPGTYQFAYIPFQKPELMNRLTVKDPMKIPENSGGTAHSEYILSLSEMGLPGLVALLLILYRWSVIAFIKARQHPGRKWIVVAFAAISTYLFHALFNNFLDTDKFAFLFWGMAAYLIAVYELYYEERILPGS